MNKKLWVIIAVILIAAFGFLNYQVDDEVYYGVNELVDIDKSVDRSEGVARVAPDFKGVYASTPVLSLRPGNYTMEIDHQGTDGTVTVRNNGEALGQYVLPADELITKLSFSLPSSSDHLVIEFSAAGDGEFTFKHMNFYSDRVFYTDSIAGAVFLILLAAALIFFLQSNGFQEKSDQKKSFLVLSAVLLVFVSYPLFNNFLNYSQDLRFHLMRIEGIKEGLLGGQFPVYIYPGNMKNHGYLGALYPDLFLYIPALLRLLGVSAVTAYKFLLLLIQIATLCISYFSFRVISKSEKIAIAAMVMYMLSPYRLLDIYIRGALGESLALLFLPLVLAGLYELLIGNTDKWYYIVLGLSGVVQSHIISGLLIGVVCILFVPFYLKKIFAEKRVVAIIKAFLATVIINMGFLVPFFYYYPSELKMSVLRMFGFYEMAAFPSQLFMMDATMNYAEVLKSGISGELVTGIGMVGIVGIVLVILYLVLQKDRNPEEHRFVTVCFITELLYILAATSWFPWETLQKIQFIDKIVVMIQFPWRLLGVAAVLGAITTAIVLFRTDFLRKHLYSLCVIFALLGILGSVKIMDTYLEQDVLFTKMSGNVGDSFHGEYTPESADLDSLTWQDGMQFAENQITVTEYNKKRAGASFRYHGEGGNVTLPLLYYKGYRAFLDDGSPLTVSESENGQICITLPSDDSDRNVVVSYQYPSLFLLGYGMSLIGVIALVLMICSEKKKNKKVSCII